MKILLKNIIRNILSNKRRTFALILCMAAAAFSAMTAFSISASAKDALRMLMMQFYGDSDIFVLNPYGSKNEIVLPDGAEAFYEYSASIDVQKRSADNFIYPTKLTYPVIGMDAAEGYRRWLLPLDGEITLSENEIIVTEALEKVEGLSVGSTIDVCDSDKQPLTLTVKCVVPNELMLKGHGACVVASAELTQRLSGKSGAWEICYIRAGSGNDASAVYEFISENNPSFAAQALVTEDVYYEIFIMLFGIFLVLAMIIFVVTSGISEHIIRERMSQLGTLRSLGATKGFAAFSLIAENLFYGLTGAVIGIILYFPAHKPLLDSIISMPPYLEQDYSIGIHTVLTVLLVTALLSCGSSVKATLKAVKTPIRDIIFGGRDTAYTLRKKRCIAGAAMMLAGVICALAIADSAVILISIVCFVTGFIFFMPMLLDLVRKLMMKCGKPVIRFSFINIATKKTIVDAAVVYAAVIGLVLSVFMLICNIHASLYERAYSGDVIVTGLSMSEVNYRFIPAIDEAQSTELIYKKDEFAVINGEAMKSEITVLGYDGPFEMYRGFKDLPEHIGEDEVSLDAFTMNKLGIREGDTVNLTLNAQGERPIRLSLKAARGCNSQIETYGLRNGIAINLDTYRKYFFDSPSAAVVRVNDPANIPALKEKIRTWIMDKNADVRTYEEYDLDESAGDAGMDFMLGAIVGIGALLSVILLITNQSIGFEQRKKELAVLHSTSMSKAQIKRMLFCETAFSILISSAAALISGFIEYILMMNFVSVLSGIEETLLLFIPESLAFLAAMYAVALITTVGGGRRLRKMNTAEQMKYE